MENEKLKEKKFNIWKKIRKIRLTRKNFGWWILSIFVLILIGGTINSWINPEDTYFAPIMWIIDILVLPFGDDLGSIDYRMPTILEGLASGASLTFIISIVSVVIGFFFAIVLAVILVNRSHLYGLKFISQLYIDFFRSTPLIVQILLVYFGMPSWLIQFIRDLNVSTEIFAGTLALSLNTAAYQAEIIRSGISFYYRGYRINQKVTKFTVKIFLMANFSHCSCVLFCDSIFIIKTYKTTRSKITYSRIRCSK
ncbi:MAG: ABC transporter permease subunit [Promethearchaeota archaeon]